MEYNSIALVSLYVTYNEITGASPENKQIN